MIIKSRKRQRIIRVYEALSKVPSAEPTSRLVAKKIGYKLDKNNNNAFVLKVIREYKNINKEN